MNDGPVVTEAMLPRLPGSGSLPPTAEASGAIASQNAEADLPTGRAGIVPLADMERQYIERAIDLFDGNIQLAARRLGISPSTIYRKKEGWVA
jgi:two-component system, repressor protein LuxO